MTTRLSHLSPSARKQAEGQGAVEEKRPRKYLNIKCQEWGIKFDSKAEMRRYGDLLNLERAGVIRDLVAHPRFELVADGMRIGRYSADASYTIAETGEKVTEDTKSPRTAKTPAFRRTLKLMKALNGTDVKVNLAN